MIDLGWFKKHLIASAGDNTILRLPGTAILALPSILIALAVTCFDKAHAQVNPDNGKKVFKKCAVCHDIGPDAKNKVGPKLNGIIGRKAGTVEGFKYSKANKTAGEKGWVWTEAVLLDYLASPRKAMPGNKMAFVGIKKEQDRKDLVAYLKIITTSNTEAATKPMKSASTPAPVPAPRKPKAETASALPPGTWVGGASPSLRPLEAPRIKEAVKAANWYGVALSGLSQPYPASFRFLEDQGAWHTPFTNPGMTGPYDLRGWHHE